MLGSFPLGRGPGPGRWRALVAFPENRLKAVVSTLCLALGLALPSLAAAEARHVENRCPQLTAEEYDELDARLQLLLSSEEPSGPLPAIVCEDGRAWVEWRGQRLRIFKRGALVDEAVDLIEGLLHDGERGTAADARAMEDSAVAAGEPVLRSPSSDGRRTAPRRRVGGGTAIGIETELPGASLPTLMGPTFSYAGSVGPIQVGGREAFRFSLGELNALLMDFEGLLAYGAPIDPEQTFGAEARFGAEWLVLYPQGQYALAAVAPIASLGLRAAQGLGAFSLWMGIDGRARVRSLSLPAGDGSTARAADLSVSFTIGGAYAVWTRK